MNIVIPMAGRGERFLNSGFTVPKPIIDINGIPMIQAAVKSLNLDGQYIFIVYEYENEEFNRKIKDAIYACCKNPKIIKINYTTQGPASSALLAKEFINNDEPLLITNCDQIMKWNSRRFLNEVDDGEYFTNYDGMVVTYDSNTEKNSYIRMETNQFGKECAVEVAEKRVISNYSLNGIHYWNMGRFFVDSAEKMIAKNIRVNNEFYISETYNQMIEDGFRISNWHIPVDQHWAIGTPEDLKRYLNENT